METLAADGFEEPPQGITIQVELIETEQPTLSALLFQRNFKIDSGELRKLIHEKVENKEADIIETVVIRTKNGMRTDTLSADGVISPQQRDGEGLVTFDIQNVGLSFKVDPVITQGAILLSGLILEQVERIADAPSGQAVTLTQPQFHRARMETTIVAKDGAYSLAGTMRLAHPHNKERKDPIVMVFLRAMINETGETKTDGTK